MQDFDGQGKAENISRIIITLCGVIGFIYGGYVQQFSMTVYCLGAGFALAALVSVNVAIPDNLVTAMNTSS